MVYVQQCYYNSTISKKNDAHFLTKPKLKYSAWHWFAPWCQASFGECQMHIPVPLSLTGHSESSECLGIANVVGFIAEHICAER